jgi:aerobic carbon-monoxide dehydrogenase medium subunit
VLSCFFVAWRRVGTPPQRSRLQDGSHRAMKPPIFDYHAPASVDEALALCERLGEDAKFLAGGQSLVPMMNFRLVHPSHLIDLNRIAGLGYVRVEGDELCIGAMTRHREVEHSSVVRDGWPLISECMPHVAHVQIRNRGTLGGSLSHADPAAELPTVMTALGAKIVLRARRGTRTVAAADFFRGSLVTAAEPGEMLTEVRVPPLPPATGFAFDEISRRRGDFAIVGAAALVRLGKDGRIVWARLVFAGIGERPTRCDAVAAALQGREPAAAALAAAAARCSDELSPQSDLHASADYRAEVAKVMAARVLARAVERSRAALP